MHFERVEHHMAHQKFDLAKLEKLNDPGRFENLPPLVMWEAIGAPTDARVIVEIGAGTALFASRFAALAPRATVYAADIEPVMIEWMRANRPEVAAGRIVPVLAEEVRVPLEDSSADVAYMINLHHELASPESSYADALRLLRPAGRFMVVDWAPGESPRGPSQHVRVPAKTVADMLSGVGFANVRIHEGALQWAWLISAQTEAAL